MKIIFLMQNLQKFVPKDPINNITSLVEIMAWRRTGDMPSSQPMVASFTHDDVIKWKHFPHYCAICGGNSPIPGEFPTQRPVTWSFDVFFDLRPNKR